MCPGLVRFPVLSQIKPQAPHLVVPFRQFRIKFQLCNHTSPGTHKLWFPGSSLPSQKIKRRQIASWHRLWLELGRQNDYQQLGPRILYPML